MVNSIARTVQNIVDNDLSLQDALQRGYGNYSAIARIIEPKVENILNRKVKLESIITSVKRLKYNYVLCSDTMKVIAESTINLRTDIAKLSVEKTRMNLSVVRQTLADTNDSFLQIIEGESVVTLIFDRKIFDKIYPLFRKEEIMDEKHSLAAITIHSPKEIINTPGCAIALYYPLARKNVNIEETISCFTDTIIVLPMEDVGKAFDALTTLMSDARKG